MADEAVNEVENVEPEVKAEETKPVDNSLLGNADKAEEVVKEQPAADKETPSDSVEIPENWRDVFANGDEAALKRLNRFKSPESFFKSFSDTQEKLRSSKIKHDKPSGDDETALAEWRKSEGIPDSAEGYQFSEETAKRMTDEDKPLLASFTEFAHERDLHPAAVEAAGAWYVEMMDKQAEEAAAKDTQDSSNLEETLRDEYGNGDYKANVTIGARYLEGIPGIGKDFSGLRKPDGTLLGNDADFVNWAVEQGRLKFGDVTFSSSDAETRHNTRKDEIEKIMRTDFERYEREGLSKEFNEIIEKELKRRK